MRPDDLVLRNPPHSDRHTRLVSLAMCLLLCLPWSAFGIPLDVTEQAAETRSVFEDLLQSDGVGRNRIIEAASVQTKKQAIQALSILEGRFRTRGDINAISPFSEPIIKLLPENDTIRFLSAIALAAQGDPHAGQQMISGRKAGGPNRLYALLAKAAIAKGAGKLKEATHAAGEAMRLDPSHPYAYNLLGQIEFVQQRPKDAASSFEKAVSRAPEFFAAHSNLGSVRFLEGDIRGAFQSFDRAVQIAPDFCPPRIGRATIWVGVGDFDGAIDDLRTCVRNDRSQLLARKRLADLYIQTGKLREATELVRGAGDKNSVFTRLTLAEIYLRKDNVGAARAQLTGIKTKNAQAYYLLAFCDVMDDLLIDALSDIREAQRLQPESVALKMMGLIVSLREGRSVDLDALTALGRDATVGLLANFVLGNVQASQDRFIEAQGYWSRADGLVPGFILKGLTPDQVRHASASAEQKFLSLGMLFYLKSYYPAALAEFEKAIQVNPNSFLANFFAAQTLAQLGDSSKIDQYLLQSLKDAPEFFPANYMLAERVLRGGDIKQAIEYYSMAARSFPDQGVLIKLGLLHDQLGQSPAAEKAYQIFITQYPNSFLGYNQLAWHYAKRGVSLDKAMRLAKKADKLQPGNAGVNDTIGWIFFQKKSYGRAEKYISKANEISQGRNPDILYHMAVVQHRNGMTKTAIRNLEQALEISAKFETVDKAKQLLSEMTSPKQ